MKLIFIFVLAILADKMLCCASIENEQNYFTEETPDILRIDSLNAFTHAICWNPVENADGYYVYAASDKNGEYSYIGTADKTCSIRHEDLKIGVSYYYKVQAYKIADGTYYYSKISYAVQKKAGCPGTPSISVQKTSVRGKKLVIIRWSNISDASHIQLFRKKNGNKYKKILDKKISGNIKKGVTITYYETRGSLSFKIRTYNTSNGIRYYSKYSVGKKVKLK